MGKASRAKHRAAARTPVKRNRSQQWWYVATMLIVVLGIFLIVLTKSDNGGTGNAAADRPRVDFAHWHAALGVNVCGEWLPNAPAFEVRSGTDVPAGINTHGDGLIHIQPTADDESGENATLGRFMEFGGWKVTPDSFDVWGDVSKKTGDKCGGDAADVRWSVDGEEQDGDPAEHALGDLEVIAIALLPDGEEIGEPPSAGDVFTPDDMSQISDTTAEGATTTTVAGATTVPGETTTPGATTAPGETTAPGDTTVPTDTPGGVETTLPAATTEPPSGTTAPTTEATVAPPPTAPTVP